MSSKRTQLAIKYGLSIQVVFGDGLNAIDLTPARNMWSLNIQDRWSLIAVVSQYRFMYRVSCTPCAV